MNTKHTPGESEYWDGALIDARNIADILRDRAQRDDATRTDVQIYEMALRSYAAIAKARGGA